MALAAILKSVDDLSDELKKEYKEQDDGSFILDVTPVEGTALEDTSGLKNTLGRLRNDIQNLKDQLKTFEGIEDPEAALEALSKVDEIKNWDGDKKVQEAIAANKNQLVRAHQKEKDELRKEVESTQGQLKKVLVENAAVKAITDAGGKVKVLLPHVTSAIQMKKNDTGEYSVSVVDSDGIQRVGDSQGNPMTIPQLVEEYKQNDDFAGAFSSSQQTGTGNKGKQTPGAPSGAKVVSSSDIEGMGSNLESIAEGKTKVNM